MDSYQLPSHFDISVIQWGGILWTPAHTSPLSFTALLASWGDIRGMSDLQERETRHELSKVWIRSCLTSDTSFGMQPKFMEISKGYSELWESFMNLLMCSVQRGCSRPNKLDSWCMQACTYMHKTFLNDEFCDVVPIWEDNST